MADRTVPEPAPAASASVFPGRHHDAGAQHLLRPWSARRLLLIGPVALALDLLAIEVFPRAEHTSNSVSPSLVTWAGVGGTLVLTTFLLLYAGVRTALPRARLLALYAVFYNALLIVVKFVLAPAAFVNTQARPTTFINLGDPFMALLATVTVFILYSAAFLVLFAIHRQIARKALRIPVLVKPIGTGVIVALVCIGIVCFVLFAVAALVLLIPFFVYLGYVFASALGLVIAVALVAAVIVANEAFREAEKQAIALRDMTVLTSFAWIGLAFIAVYHALWFVYILLLLSLWPLKLLAPPK